MGLWERKKKIHNSYKLLHPKSVGRSKGVRHNECEASKELKKEILKSSLEQHCLTELCYEPPLWLVTT